MLTLACIKEGMVISKKEWDEFDSNRESDKRFCNVHYNPTIEEGFAHVMIHQVSDCNYRPIYGKPKINFRVSLTNDYYNNYNRKLLLL